MNSLLWYRTRFTWRFCAIAAIGLAQVICGWMLEVRILIWLGGATLVYGVASTAGWYLARFVLPGSPIKFADNVVSTLSQDTAENVLDVGTGRGLFAIAAAKRMPHAKVIGIDVWDPPEPWVVSAPWPVSPHWTQYRQCEAQRED